MLVLVAIVLIRILICVYFAYVTFVGSSALFDLLGLVFLTRHVSRYNLSWEQYFLENALPYNLETFSLKNARTNVTRLRYCKLVRSFTSDIRVVSPSEVVG